MEQKFDFSKIDPKILKDDGWEWIFLLLAIFFCGENGWGKNLADIDTIENPTEENRPG